jgi:hypothetical protein
VKNKEELSKKIEILEGSIAEKENNIMDFSKKSNNELINITKGQEKKLDDQMAIIKQQNEKIDVLTDTVMKVVNLLEKK